MNTKTKTLISIFAFALLASRPVHAREMTSADLIKYDFEDLVNFTVQIGSAGKSVTSALDLAYAGYVITASEIRSSGAQNIPDALRLAPGLNVGQITAAEWSTGIRGAGGRYSRYVLVMVDDRIVYNNIFAGVNWDELNINIEKIARIEIIRGPNAAAWGANAVNGIIHIITKHPSSLQDKVMSATAGGDGYANVNGVWNLPGASQWQLDLSFNASRWDGLAREAGGTTDGSHNDYRVSLAAYRDTGVSSTYLSTDVYAAEQSPVLGWVDVERGITNVGKSHEDKKGFISQATHKHQWSAQGHWKVRGSIESTRRTSGVYYWNDTNYQVDFELGISLAAHKITAGIFDRVNQSDVDLTAAPGDQFEPPERTISTYGVFINDHIELSEKWLVNLGLRVDDSDISRSNLQSSVRSIWHTSDSGRFWAAASEGFSTPPRGMTDGNEVPYAVAPATESSPPIVLLLDGYLEDPHNTRLRALELGYRQAFGLLSLDAALFEYQYVNEIGVVPKGDIEYRTNADNQQIGYRYFNFLNNREYASRGGELVLRGQLTPVWSSQLIYSYVKHVKGADSSSTTVGFVNTFTFTPSLNFYTALRYNQGSTAYSTRTPQALLEFGEPDDYLVLDANINWMLSTRWEFNFIASNLGAPHTEAVREEYSSDILLVEPNAMLKLRYQY